jgi:hypothetical protein
MIRPQDWFERLMWVFLFLIGTGMLAAIAKFLWP